MTPTQLFLVVLFPVVLLGLAGYFAFQQGRTLRGLAGAESMPVEDRRYYRNQAWRRLAGCVLMVLFAGLFAGWFLLGLDELANQLIQDGEAARAEGIQAAPTPQQRHILSLCSIYLIFAMLVLLGMLITAGLDLWAIRSYGLRHHQKINADRRAMIERQVALLRSQRNGHE